MPDRKIISRESPDMTRVVMGLLFNGDKQILIARRNRQKRYGGLWEFPGGKIEAGESIEEALKREIIEELAAPIIIDEVHPGYLYEYQNMKAFFIPVSGSIRPDDITLLEHDEFRFVSTSDFDAFDFSPYDFGAIDLLQQKAG
jgi:8-oxo-dGTP diphosphatase